ncbi:uncharacterized protein EV420DRAFT_156031 [Desarmillaria tabescens]|uniref:Uncharacterized protein n=1 Tax=Armillaria tabescens TaxID=1929756 RepID=A0AA39MKZ4_ARMTA|nr:uncharacterized protein EV420DRAFT_156031 [Desarmillaria tabescens]KAK0437748.1 hypothetical protein EV420DRAFT_156031 [Desarmillaria tabescens]
MSIVLFFVLFLLLSFIFVLLITLSYLRMRLQLPVWKLRIISPFSAEDQCRVQSFRTWDVLSASVLYYCILYPIIPKPFAIKYQPVRILLRNKQYARDSPVRWNVDKH